MKKIFFILFVIIIGISIYNLKEEDKEIRVRIISNSNSNEDLQYKKEISIIVENYLFNNYDKDYHNYKNNIISNLNDLNTKINNEAVKVVFKEVDFPEKSYKGNYYERKKVETLLITIGEGNGDNYWGILYPDYIGLNDDNVVVKSWIIDNIRGD